MSTDLTFNDILHMIERKIEKRIEKGKPACTMNCIKIHTLISEHLPKKCNKCGKEKRVKDFYKNRKVCKSCFTDKYIKKKDTSSKDNKEHKSTKDNKNNKDSKSKDTKPKVTNPKKQDKKTNNKTDKKTDKTKDKKKSNKDEQASYDLLYGKIGNVSDMYFSGNKFKVIDRGCKLFHINEDIHTKDHLIEEVLKVIPDKYDRKTYTRMKKFMECVEMYRDRSDKP